MRIISLRSLTFILALSLFSFGCSDSSTGPGSGSDSNPATVNGRVDDNGSNKSLQKADVEGLVVTAATIDANGNLQTVSGAETETNAEGEFALQIDAEAISNAASRVVVMTEQNGQTIKAFVSQELSSGSEVTVQPLTFESSAEANVFAEVVADGNTDLVTQADIAAVVTQEMSAEIMGNSEASAQMAAALAAKAEAEADFYADQGIEFTQQQKDDVMNIKADALASLEANLDAAANVEEENEAVAAFTETVAKAQLEAGVQASAVAKSSELSSRVVVKESTELSSSAQSELRKNMATMLAYGIDAAVQTQMEVAAASESSVNAAADAAIDLRANIKSMTSATKEDIDAAFEAYNSAVIDVLQNEFSANASAFVEVNSTINESNGAKSTLESSLIATLDTSVMIDAYTTFYSTVESEVDAAFTTVSETEADAFTEIMIYINLAS